LGTTAVVPGPGPVAAGSAAPGGPATLRGPETAIAVVTARSPVTVPVATVPIGRTTRVATARATGPILVARTVGTVGAAPAVVRRVCPHTSILPDAPPRRAGNTPLASRGAHPTPRTMIVVRSGGPETHAGNAERPTVVVGLSVWLSGGVL